MAVKDFECQIARGQIGRYVGGEMLSPEALRQLGLHVAECDDCRDHLEARRAALQSMVSGGRPTATSKPTTSTREPAPRAAHTSQTQAPMSGAPSQAVVSPAAQALMDQIRRRAGDGLPLTDKAPTLETPPATPVTKPNLMPLLGKPAMYSIALAAVLIGMTYISKNPTSFFGPRLAKADKNAKTTDAKNDTPASDKPAEAPKAAEVPTTKVDSKANPAPVSGMQATGPAPVATASNTAGAPEAPPTIQPTPTASNLPSPVPTKPASVGHEPVGHGPLPKETTPTPPPASTPVPDKPVANAATDVKANPAPKPAPEKVSAQPKPEVAKPKAETSKSVAKPKAPIAKRKPSASKSTRKPLRRRHRARGKGHGTAQIKLYTS